MAAKMADNENQVLDTVDKIGEKKQLKCYHCSKPVVNSIKCIKCLSVFHPSCMEQAASQKNTECTHVPDKTNKKKCVSSEEKEISLLRTLVAELQSKNKILEENRQLLREKIENLILKVETCEKGECKHHVIQKFWPENKVGKKERSTQNHFKDNHKMIPNVETINHENPNRDEQSIDTGSTVKNNKMGNAPAKQLTDDSCLNEENNTNEVCTNENIGNEKIREKPQEKPVLPENRSKSENNEKWKEVSYRNNRRPTKSSRPAPLVGSNSDSNLKAAQRISFLFVSGLAPEVKEQDILEYLKNQNLKPAECIKMKTKKEKYRSSFKLSVSYEEREKFLNTAVWPKNVVINHFLNLQRPAGTLPIRKLTSRDRTEGSTQERM